MATKSIIKNIEISDPAEAEKLVKALEEAERIRRLNNVRLTDDQIKMARITYTKVVQDDFILDLIDTIEALQQENDRLKELLADWKYNTKCDADHIAALTADKDEQARKTRQLEEGLRSTLKVLETLNYRGGLGLDIHKWLRDEMQTVNALLGGKENGK